MAKKTHAVNETGSSMQPKMVVAFLSHGSQEPLDELKKVQEVVYVSPKTGAEAIADIAQKQADIYIVAPETKHFRNHYLHELQNNIALGFSPNTYYTIVTGSNKGRMTELLSGVGKAEWNASCVAFGKDAYTKFCDQNITPVDAFELAYLAEKTCCANTILQADKKEISKIKAGVALKKKFKTSLKFYTGGGKKAMHKFLFLGLSLLALILTASLSRNAGISGDEFTQYEYSKLTANYFDAMLGNDIKVDTLGLKGQKMTTLATKAAAGGDLSNLATQEDPDRLMHLYGASFDTFTTLLIRWFGISDVMDFRHLVNSFFGFLCMFFGALIMRRATGGSWKYAWITLVMLFVTPRLLGESFNNPKDIPFAAGYVISIYYAIKAFSNLKVIRTSAVIGLVLATALGISIRIGGLLSIAIFVAYAGLRYINFIGTKNFFAFKWKGFFKLLVTLVIAGFASYIIGILFWPYGMDDPFTNPMKAFKSFSNYAGSIRQLFEGKLFDSDMLPRYYLFKYVIITTPIAALLGILLNFVLPAWKKKKFSTDIFLILFAAVFPVLYIFTQKSQVYGGLRHILFTIPFFVMSGVVGYYLIENWLAQKSWAKFAVPGVALGLSLLPAAFIAKNHPLEYIYFNETVGGTAGAYGNYEMDYYLAGLRPSSEWFLNNVARKNPAKKYVLLTYGMDQVKYYCRNDKNVQVGFTRYDDRSEKKWDYAIFYNAYLDKQRLLGGKYPPIGTVFSPLVAGKPMGLVIQRPSLADYEGFQADRAGNYRLAVQKYFEYLKADPNSNEVYLYLSSAYANLGNLDSAIWSAKKSVELYPEFTKSLMALTQYYTGKKDYNNAIKAMDQYLEARPKDADAWLMKAQAQGQKGDYLSAIQSVRESIGINPLDVRAYQMGAAVYQMQKDNLNTNLYAEAIGAFTGKDATAKQKGLEAIKNIYMDITGKELDMGQGEE